MRRKMEQKEFKIILKLWMDDKQLNLRPTALSRETKKEARSCGNG